MGSAAGNISKGGVCVAGDALHPMTPDIDQVDRLKREPGEDEEKFKKIEMGLKRYAKERRWRSFELICTAYVVVWRVIVDVRTKIARWSFRGGDGAERLRQLKSWRKEDLKANVRVVEIFATHRTRGRRKRGGSRNDRRRNEEMPNLRSKIEEMEREKAESKRRVEELEEMIGFMSRRGGCKFEEEEDQFGGCGLWKFGIMEVWKFEEVPISIGEWRF
ncbi:hypothetical protein Patl1_36063 [Pistacia atlantica]|nr:hypothetical protein Patl1_36063 [Pistacia atlantica]